jgi:SpoVK/Ycf46/Vps4 family AAA+-type ATPase
MKTRQELEQALLRQPFDAALRTRYAEHLLESGAHEPALAQFEMIAQQKPHGAPGHVGAARALLALGRHSDAAHRYAKARLLEDFAPRAELESLEASAQRSAPKLQVVAAMPSNVVPLQRVSEEKVRFSSIAGMDELKRTIRLKIIDPFLNPSLFQRFRQKAGGGILLYGPPGCGKTMMARAVANECNAQFISVGISDILSRWIGDSESNLAAMFAKARAEAPCVLFFDELDALAYSRSKASSEHSRTVVNEFLAQLDGVDKDNKGVLILAATNMPWDVDSAMKRPGRFSRQIFVPPPDAAARQKMLEIKLTGIPTEALDLAAIARDARHYSGADMDGLIELATEAVLEDFLRTHAERPLRQSDFTAALSALKPSTQDWLRTARNLVKYAGDDGSYRDVETYLKVNKLL